ncbi:MAG: COX15/CtaA family protein [Gammaproteobacteria bacterium]|nr:COX15/CtaA family protein [Gammaproteobacteria bacterium]NNF49848.1 heme A synthase [Woeseiaceae bacterium]MBT8094670.1 COX15/CtaA family protein [Gammaproteobacteria bacterium]MBT8105838.1 COX15/CtaA family protein [Gammaproteobacteria bacterium]NNK25852.1 heme A synthase [Woeseiaceae bacterium]
MFDTIDNNNKAVAKWLLICCGLVFAMVVLGGFTRLTGSGLSMVDWRPLMGVLPPLGEAEWQRVFEMYQQSPEFRQVNAAFGVDEFKGIFWLEYLHRLLGRLIGIVFLLPFVYFLARGYIPLRHWPKYALMFVLGGLQGLLGWYMVRSGLVDVPHVSQYRLTAHLVLAFTIYAYMLWVAMSLLFPADGKAARHAWFGRAAALLALVSVTIVSGGFVAGLKAGKIYNTFPMMGDDWIPPNLMVLEPAWRNLFSNPVTAQFDHRLLAITTFVLIVIYWFRSRAAQLPQRARRAGNALLHTAILQVALGIAALLLAVPVVLGAAHQAVGMLLFTVTLFLVHALRRA